MKSTLLLVIQPKRGRLSSSCIPGEDEMLPIRRNPSLHQTFRVLDFQDDSLYKVLTKIYRDERSGGGGRVTLKGEQLQAARETFASWEEFYSAYRSNKINPRMYSSRDLDLETLTSDDSGWA